MVQLGSARAQASLPAAPGPWLLVGQLGFSPWGRADNYPEGGEAEEEDDGTGLGDYGEMLPALDLRVGVDYLPSRWFAASLSVGASRWQTELFETIGRGPSYTLDALLMPRFRIPLSRRRPGFALFVGAGAGPALSFVSDNTVHAQVSEQLDSRIGYSVAWTHGADFQIVRRIGLRVQIDAKWTAVRYDLRRTGPHGALASTRFDDMLTRPLFLIGVWFRP
jgi:hypothetical protein